jgi:Ca2+-transporting ATPase
MAKMRETPSSSGTVATVLRAFCNQLREPLILMFLFLAGVPLCLGNAADVVSIRMALVIVSMVAAIQEYRSKRDEWCKR